MSREYPDTEEGLGLDNLPAEVANAPLALDNAQQIRVLALTMAVRYHSDTIIKDAGMYTQLKMEGSDVKPTSPEFVLRHAIAFERYLRGDYAEQADQLVGGDFAAWLDERVKEASNKAMELLDGVKE